jgi:hypothetical protein
VTAGLSGCSKSYDGDQRFPVSGKVTVDGQPMDLGVISFLPKDAGKGPGRVSGGPIRDGMYSVSEDMGPTAAAYRVEIHWNKKTGKQIPNPMDPDAMMDEMTEGLPDKCHKESELTAEVSPAKTTFSYDLTTK